MSVSRSPVRKDATTPEERNTEAKEIQANEFRNVRLTTFWRNQPKLWFAQLECEFKAYRIRSDEIKYGAIVRHLDESTINMVGDILENPPETGKYEKLKTSLIERFTDSMEKRLRTLLDGIELGDKTPSTLLREMRNLAGANVTDNMLKTLWMQRLPARTQELLAVFDDADLNKLATCADKAAERAPTTHNIAAVENTNQQQILEKLVARVEEIATQVAVLRVSTRQSQQHNNRDRRHRSQSRNRKRSQTRTPEQNGMCFYHRKFADRAWRCTKPCTATWPLAQQGNEDDHQQ